MTATTARHDALAIRTPEGIEFALPLAGPVSRMLAMLVDLLVISGLTKITGILLTPLELFGPDLSGAVSTIVYFVFTFAYGIFCEWRLHGQTLGKRIFKLRVVDAGGLRLEPSQVIIRNLMRLIDGLPAFYLVGGAAALWNPSMQRLGDIAAGTAVIRTPAVSQPDLAQILGSRFNSLLEHRRLCAQLRHKVRPELAALAVHALIRRESLDASSRLAVFADLATHFRSLVEFPPDITEALGDEQYVRNVVEVLYRK